MNPSNILVSFDDGSQMVYARNSSVRIANRGPSDVRMKDYEQVQTRPPKWFGFQNFEARILAIGHQLLTHRGFRTVVDLKHGVDLPEGDQAVLGQHRPAEDFKTP